jgi:hypothetical protein
MTFARSCRFSSSPNLRAGLLLVGLVVLVFGRICFYGWIDWDDDVHISRNPGLNPVTLSNVAGFWVRPYELLYIPVSYTFFAGEVLLSRALFPPEPGVPPDPRPFHAISLLLHASCVLLVWRLIARRVRGCWPAVAGAALFAVHPLQVESVAWISEQRGLLATLLSLAAIALHFRSGGEESPTRRSCTTVAGIACFGLAMLAKPQAVVVPLLLLILEPRTPGRSVLGTARGLWLWFLMAAGVGVIAKAQQPSDWSWEGAAVSPMLRPIVAGDAIGFYATKLLLPFGLCIDHGRTPAVVLASPWLCLRAVATLGAVAAPWFVPGLRGCRTPVGLALAGLLPVLGLVPFTFQGFSTVAERYAYLPMLGPALGVALALDHARATRLRPLLPWATSLGILVLGVLSARQTAVWQSRSTLNAHAVRTNPRTYGARLNLAATLIDEGKIAEAADILRRAVEANPDYVKARYELGSTLHKLGELAEAEVHYEAAIRLRPQWSYVHNDLGILLAQQGRLTDALARFRAAVALRPDLPGPRQNLQQVERLLAGPSSPDPGNGETPPSAKPGQ